MMPRMRFIWTMARERAKQDVTWKAFLMLGRRFGNDDTSTLTTGPSMAKVLAEKGIHFYRFAIIAQPVPMLRYRHYSNCKLHMC